ncbi:VOC family protein [Paenibacillus sp. KQZ6P-2]|uniref:VOC family protein n=1 Tax=Paenibacillus mangrovi TaxID=2931978 RepID=A0A9X1WK18_9BACL|nr:VOC family protein [Paenibacillus mangrovi]MCJ8010767.1 VOC family protein [Paenibacillus mangrovi]
MDRIIGFHCLHLPVSNVEKSVDFFVKQLGFELVRGQEKGKYTNALIKIGNSPTIFLSPVMKVENALKFESVNQKEHAIFEIGTKDIDSLYKQLKEEGVRVTDRYDNPGCGKYFEVYDPDGHMFCVCQDWYNRFE